MGDKLSDSSENVKRWNSPEALAYWDNFRQEVAWENSDYQKSLVDFVAEFLPAPGKCLDVGIGSAEPAAVAFVKLGYDVSGIDVSEAQIERVRATFPEIDARVGDSNKIEFSADTFDLVYSFESSWYFDNIKQSIDEMIGVTKEGGSIVFDIRNKYNPLCPKYFFRHLIKKAMPGFLYELLMKRKKYNTPFQWTSPFEVKHYLKQNGWEYTFYELDNVKSRSRWVPLRSRLLFCASTERILVFVRKKRWK